MVKSFYVSVLCVVCGALVGCGNYVSYDGDASAVEVESMPVVLEDAPKFKQLDHLTFAGVLAAYSSTSTDQNYVVLDYASMSQSEEALYELERYAALLASIDPLTLESEDERFAFFINAYNVSVIRGVLERFDGDASGFSVLESEGFFKDRLYTVGGQTLSLDQVENLVMRGKFEDATQTAGLDDATLVVLRSWFDAVFPDGVVDARLHAAVNCGALGCPNLNDSAPFVYQATQLDAQLEQATARWLSNAEKGAGPDGISMIFTWFVDDFNQDAGSVEAFIAAHREGGIDGVSLDDRLDYDWSLNSLENVD